MIYKKIDFFNMDKKNGMTNNIIPFSKKMK